MAGVTRASMEAFLKEHYTSHRVENLVYDENPLLAILTKDTSGFGEHIKVPVIYGTGGRRSATFSQAQARGLTTATKGKAFLMEPVQDFSTATIDGITLATAEGDQNSFLRKVTMEIDSVITELQNALGRTLYGNGWGAIGQVASSAGSTITLADPYSTDFFEEGTEVVFAASESASALRDSGDSLVVSSVDRDAGTVTFSAAVSGISGLQNNDYIFTKGDREDSATPTRLCITGLDAWIPTTAIASNDSFWNVNRYADPARLAGSRYAPPGGTPINAVLLNMANIIKRRGGKLTHFFMHPDRWNELQHSLDSRVTFMKDVVVASVGFRAIEIETVAGTVKVMSDRNCPYNKVYGLNIDTWSLFTGGPLCGALNEDGVGSMLRLSTSDGYEIRYGHYLQLGCFAPGRNIVASLSA